jgi:hypothetical protein
MGTLQQTSITVYRLSTKENKLPFLFAESQTEVCHLRFPFAANKRNSPFSVSSVFRKDMLKWQNVH